MPPTDNAQALAVGRGKLWNLIRNAEDNRRECSRRAVRLAWCERLTRVFVLITAAVSFCSWVHTANLFATSAFVLAVTVLVVIPIAEFRAEALIWFEKWGDLLRQAENLRTEISLSDSQLADGEPVRFVRRIQQLALREIRLLAEQPAPRRWLGTEYQPVRTFAKSTGPQATVMWNKYYPAVTTPVHPRSTEQTPPDSPPPDVRYGI